MQKISGDFWRHFGVQLAAVTVPVLLHFIAGYDWSSLGPYAVLIPSLAGVATEMFNQALATVPAGYTPAPKVDAK
jgi:hypothetical protein